MRNVKGQLKSMRINAKEDRLGEIRGNLLQLVGKEPIRGGWTVLMPRYVLVGSLSLLLIAGSGGLVMASQDSLPGNWLYPVKILVEEVEVKATVQPAKKVELKEKFKQRRKIESETLRKKQEERKDEKAKTFEKESAEEVRSKIGSVQPGSMVQVLTTTGSTTTKAEKYEKRETAGGTTTKESRAERRRSEKEQRVVDKERRRTEIKTRLSTSTEPQKIERATSSEQRIEKRQQRNKFGEWLRKLRRPEPAKQSD